MNNIFKGIISYNKIELIGLKTELTKSQNKNFKIISNQWKILNSTLHEIKGRATSYENWVKYGVTYKENGKYYYLASIPFEIQYSYPSRMLRKNITKGYYALYYHKGEIRNISKSVSCIFKESIPTPDFNIILIESSGIIYFEKYDRKFHWNNPDSIVELFLPVEKNE